MAFSYFYLKFLKFLFNYITTKILMYYLISVTHPSLKSAKCDSVSIIFRQCNKHRNAVEVHPWRVHDPSYDSEKQIGSYNWASCHQDTERGQWNRLWRGSYTIFFLEGTCRWDFEEVIYTYIHASFIHINMHLYEGESSVIFTFTEICDNAGWTPLGKVAIQNGGRIL